MLRRLSGLLIAVGLAAPAANARLQEGGFARLELRVISARPGSAVVDRGTSDALAAGDRVQFYPRTGVPFEGTVARLEERSAVVELHDVALVPVPGTRGEVRIPADRLEARIAPEESAPVAQGDRADSPDPDSGWTPDQPLLAKVRPLRPEERPATVTGRLVSAGDQITSSEDDRSDGFFRVGASVLYDNFRGRGDQLAVDVEINNRRTAVPDLDGEDTSRLRFDRLSYAWGGTRFADTRAEFGRFLQQGLPEFGVIDGFEWGRRLDGGDRYGASLGFLPEPDAEYESFSDFQAAAYYRWVRDESERFSVAGGYQKSFHNGNADRDLFVVSLHDLPPEGWSFHGTAWIDMYTAGDAAKGSGFEVTQAYANASRYWRDGVAGDGESSLHVIYTHLAFPELDRHEFPPLAASQLASDHNDRLAVSGRKPVSGEHRLHGAAGAWVDEDESGGDLELGLDTEDLLLAPSLADITVFGTAGRFSDTLGARFSLARYVGAGEWRIGYELALHQLDGFSNANDDLPQHRLRASREFHTVSGWSFSGRLEAGFWDDEDSLAAGFYLQKGF